jgi:hypothetical protein
MFSRPAFEPAFFMGGQAASQFSSLMGLDGIGINGWMGVMFGRNDSEGQDANKS